MNIIEQLKYHDNNQLEEWLDLDGKTTKKFMKDLVQFFNENEAELKQYCINTLPSEFSSLSIIYEALSEYSVNSNEFLYEEIRRVTTLAKEKRINPKFLNLLTDIELEDIYDKDEGVFIKILDFLTMNLHLDNAKEFNTQLLEVIDWYLINLDEDDEIPQLKNWTAKIESLANNSANITVKIKAREVLNETDSEISFKPLSFMEKIKAIFK